MILIDSNVLIYAFRKDSPDHQQYLHWLEETLSNEPLIGYADLILSAVIRVTTHPKIFNKPSSVDEAFRFTTFIRTHPSCIAIVPGEKHWEIFQTLCKKAAVKGNLVTDAYLAALAIESGAEFVTTDRDFARFPKLRWRHPLG